MARATAHPIFLCDSQLITQGGAIVGDFSTFIELTLYKDAPDEHRDEFNMAEVWCSYTPF